MDSGNQWLGAVPLGVVAGCAASVGVSLGVSLGVVLAAPAAAQNVAGGNVSVGLAQYGLGGAVSIMAGTTLTPVSGSGLVGAPGTVWSISNAGVVDAGLGDGIWLGGSGQVGNTGSITGGVDGVRLDAGGAVNNGQSGLVQGGSYGVLVQNAAGEVSNAGLISGRYDGVSLNRGGNVENLAGGTISGAHIGVYTGGGLGSVANSGLISGGTGDGVSLYGGGSLTNAASGRILGGYSGVYAAGSGSSIQNAGVISGSDFGVYLTGASVVNNSGRISGGVDGVIDVAPGGEVENTGVISGASIGVRLAAASSVVNSGTISGGAAGVRLGADSVLNNSGRISGATAILVTGRGSSVDNTGVVAASAAGGDAIALEGGADSLTLGTGSAVEGEIDGGGTDSTVTLQGTGTLGGGIRNFGAGSTLDLAAGADWTASGDWTVASVRNEGVFQPGVAGAPLDLTGDFSQASGGTMRVAVSPQGVAHFNVDGAVQLGGALVYVLAPGAYAPASDDFLTATGEVTGRFASVTSDQSQASDGPQQVPTQAVALVAGAQAVNVVVTGKFTVAPGDDALFGEAREAMAQDAQDANDTLLAHAAGGNAGPCAPVGGSMAGEVADAFCAAGGWVEARGTGMDTHGGFSARGAGFLAGLDRRVGDDTLGLAVGVGEDGLTDTSGGREDADTTRFGVYGGQRLGVFTLSGDVVAGFTTARTTRQTGDGGAVGRASGNVFGAAVQFSTAMGWGGLQLRPAAGMELAHVQGGGFSEQARAQAFAVSASDSAGDSLRPFLRLAISEPFVTAAQLAVTPQVSLELADELGDAGRAVRLTANDGSVFAAGARGLNGAAAQMMAGVSAGRGRWSLSLQFAADVAGAWTGQAVEGGVEVRF